MSGLDCIPLEVRKRLGAPPSTFDADSIIHLLVCAANLTGSIRVSADDSKIEIQYGSEREFCMTDDHFGKLRMLLARMFFICKSSYPRSMDGDVYGFTARVEFPVQDAEARLFDVETDNSPSFPFLAISAHQVD